MIVNITYCVLNRLQVALRGVVNPAALQGPCQQQLCSTHLAFENTGASPAVPICLSHC